MSAVKIPPEGDPIVISEKDLPKNIGELGVYILKSGRVSKDVYIRCYIEYFNGRHKCLDGYSLENRKDITLYVLGQDRDRDDVELSEEECKEIIRKCL